MEESLTGKGGCRWQADGTMSDAERQQWGQAEIEAGTLFLQKAFLRSCFPEAPVKIPNRRCSRRITMSRQKMANIFHHTSIRRVIYTGIIGLGEERRADKN